MLRPINEWNKQTTTADGDSGARRSKAGAEAPAVGREDVEEADAAPLEMIRREDDFQGWLAQQKEGWRKHRDRSRLKRSADARSQVRSDSTLRDIPPEQNIFGFVCMHICNQGRVPPSPDLGHAP